MKKQVSSGTRRQRMSLSSHTATSTKIQLCAASVWDSHWVLELIKSESMLECTYFGEKAQGLVIAICGDEGERGQT